MVGGCKVFPGDSEYKETVCNARALGWLPTPVFLSGEFHGQRSSFRSSIYTVDINLLLGIQFAFSPRYLHHIISEVSSSSRSQPYSLCIINWAL